MALEDRIMKKVLYIFGRLSDEDIEWLIANGNKESFAAGAILIKKDQPIDKLYIGLDGIFSVFVGENEDKKVAELGPGEIVGEMSFVDTSPTSATVKAEQQSIVYSIPRSKLNRKIDEDNGFAARFYHAIAIFLADRLRSTVGLFGYGELEYKSPEAPTDELDSMIMDNISIAGDRFHRMLTRMIKGG
jgi:CRP/FNR family cyclic AMP-dependent transcriptional regulator